MSETLTNKKFKETNDGTLHRISGNTSLQRLIKKSLKRFNIKIYPKKLKPQHIKKFDRQFWETKKNLISRHQQEI